LCRASFQSAALCSSIIFTWASDHDRRYRRLVLWFSPSPSLRQSGCQQSEMRHVGKKAVRAWALVVGIVYGALSLIIVAFLAANEPEDALVGAAIITPLLVACAAFIWGLITWDTRRSRIVRTVAWFALVVGAIPLISIAFILIPLLISALPSLWPWHVRTSENQP